ncbi:MAG: hypothetical protein CMI95_02720 [Pelagibacteraceae bacterium]|nr:hypothetical protein [Pelagibacteraceae bacterium]PPR51133.1 MAG: hypothetical protein CFH20_00819 [Alphaproteobacteria bacterium MarineAlpha5_Bin10]|tara:strand:- start:22606 stop:22896 length:291 start_codon:yes stop_codon:yes gene_type:complete
MKGYLIAQINVNNLENYKEYLKNVTPIAQKYGGEYIIRAGKYEVMEGDWPFKRNVVIKFPSIEKAKEFYTSKEYEPIKKIRADNADNNLILIEGAD